MRRVATLVAGGAPPDEVFEAVTGEAGRLVPADAAALGRYEPDGSLTTIGLWTAADGYLPRGSRHAIDGDGLARLVLETRRPGRIDAYAELAGSLAAAARDMGWRSSAGAPVIVAGRLWGLVAVASTTDRPLPVDAEARLAELTELLTSTIANARSREELTRLAEEQAALRRVATLVARGARPASLFAVVAEQVAHVLHVPLVSIVRYEADATATECASFSERGELFPAGTRWSLEGTNVVAQVRGSGRPARIDDYSGSWGVIAETARSAGIRSTVGIPIVVAGRLWGAMVASSAEPDPLPEGTETRLADFTELVATAISNSEARAEVHRLADEQAALRRVATLVAEAVPAHELFAAVAREAGTLLGADATRVARFEHDQELVELGGWSKPGYDPPSFGRAKLEGTSVAAEVLRTGRVARIDDYENVETRASFARGLELKSVVGAPIVVEGRRWGVMVAWSTSESLPAATERRMAGFTELVATAIANAESRAELTASRARLVTASDQTRRRFERDLHDGVQQRLVTLSLQLRSAEAMIPPGYEELGRQLDLVVGGLTSVLDDLRELSRGIHPAILSEGGLGPAIKALARRSAVPTKLELDVDKRLAERVEVAAYYVVSEALTNAEKHSQASITEVRVEARKAVLDLTIHDDGVGGADPARGSGLTSLADRVEALGGKIAIASPVGKGTSLHVELPVEVGAAP